MKEPLNPVLPPKKEEEKLMCCECGKPHAGIFVFTDAKGEMKYVHSYCVDAYVKRVLGGPK